MTKANRRRTMDDGRWTMDDGVGIAPGVYPSSVVHRPSSPLKRSSKLTSDRAILVATALVTFAAALGVSGGTNVWMLLIDNPLIKQYRPTLTFRSAIFGDGLILPLINVIMMKWLLRWRPRLNARTATLAILGGSAVSLMFHIGQARGGLVNWTMPVPWHWNLLGYYHFIFMAAQFSYIFLYLTQFAERRAKGHPITPDQKRDLALIAVSLAVFGLLLYTDYY